MSLVGVFKFDKFISEEEMDGGGISVEREVTVKHVKAENYEAFKELMRDFAELACDGDRDGVIVVLLYAYTDTGNPEETDYIGPEKFSGW